MRRTITKQLLFLTTEQLRSEVRSLLFLARLTDRDIVLPNILGNDRQNEGPLFDGLSLWPGFRVLFTRKEFDLRVNILEPAYYWRIRRDYPAYTVPRATVVVVNRSTTVGEGVDGVSVVDVLTILQSEQYRDQPRIVLSMNMDKDDDNGVAASDEESFDSLLYRLHLWSDDSVGRFSSFEVESGRYKALPGLIERADTTTSPYSTIIRSISRGTRLCADMFVFDKGNRSCFDKCD